MTSLRDFIESLELPAATFARWASICFSLSVLTFLISLAASQAFLALAGLLYAAHLLRRPAAPSFPPIKLPLALFCATTILSIGWAENPVIGWLAVRKLVLFLIILLAVNLVASTRHLVLLYKALFLEAAVAGLVGAAQFLQQYHAVHLAHPNQVYFYMTVTRISGFMGHWMNFGGQQMLVFGTALAFLMLGPSQVNRAARARPVWFWWIAAAIIATSIVLNFTRGVWLGCFVAILYLVSRWKARWLWALPVLLAVGYFASPHLLRKRIQEGLHPSADPALTMRFEIWRAGLRMVRRHPLVGVGPDNIPEVYLLYLARGEQPERGYHDHMHDDFLQFAAERGLPCLVAWVWLMLALFWYSLRIRSRLRLAGLPTWPVDGALAAWLGFMAEGFFEYNFGTSPVLMVFLFVVSTPFILERAEPGNRRAQAVVPRGQPAPATDYR